MSIDNSDHFRLWESDLSENLDLPHFPDPLDEIIDYSVDPVDCAKRLHDYVSENPRGAHSSLSRRGIAKLAYKHYGHYLNKKIAIAADGGFAIPETDKTRRKREVLESSQYEGVVFAMGHLATFLTAHYSNLQTGQEQTLITLRLSEPYLLNADGTVLTDRKLPDYMLFPIPRVLSYSFKQQ